MPINYKNTPPNRNEVNHKIIWKVGESGWARPQGCGAGTAAKVTSSLERSGKSPLLPCSLSQPPLNLGGHHHERTSLRTSSGFRLSPGHMSALPVDRKRQSRPPFRFHSGKQGHTQRDGLSKRSFAYWAGKQHHYLPCTF